MCKELNAKIKPSKGNILQLDRTNVEAIGELIDVLIILSFYHRVHQMIDIIFENITEEYCLFISWEWMQHIKGYMDTYITHLWLSKKGKSNTIRVNKE